MSNESVKDTANPGLPPLDRDAFDAGSTEDSLERLTAAAARQGGLFRIHSPPRNQDIWIVNNPADIKRILVTQHRNYTKGLGLDRIRILLGNGIMTSEGDLWKSQRRMIQPSFNRKVLERLTPTILTHLDRLSVQFTEKARHSQPIDITHVTSELTLDIILDLIFSEDLAWLSEKMGSNPFALVNEHAERDLKFAYRFRSLCRLVGELIQRRRQESLERDDFLGMLMAATDKDTQQPMADKLVIDEAMTLVVAGHETTASALNWTWYLLTEHPDAYDRLLAEIDHTPLPELPSFKDLHALAYTQAVINEALRLYPPGWILSRRNINADHLSGFEVPPGTDVMLSPYLIQRHPDYWDHPNDFKPERFLEQTQDPRDAWIYIPFAAGPRHCVGEHLALYEMILHVVHVSRTFRLSRTDRTRPIVEAAINLRTRSHLMMQLELRHSLKD